MKILLFADSHLGFDYPIHPRITRRRRGHDFFSNYQHIIDTAIENDIDILLHGGDMFFRSKIPKLIIQKAYQPLLKPLDQGIDILMVPGNHERSRLPASPIFHHPRFHVFNKPRTFTFHKNNMSVAFGGFPNIRKQIATEFKDAYIETGLGQESVDHKILCLHQAIENSVVGVQNYQFRRGKDVIGLDQFPNELSCVLSGHIHRKQVLYDLHGTPIIYPGSIERTSFAERLEQKGFYIIDLNQKRIEWVFHPLPTRKMEELLIEKHLVSKAAILDFLTQSIPHLDPEGIIRVKCSTDEQLSQLKIAELRELFPPTCNVDLSVPHRRSLRNERV